MYDLRWIRENPEAFDAGLAARGLQPLATDILARDASARTKRTALQKIQNRRNALSKQLSVCACGNVSKCECNSRWFQMEKPLRATPLKPALFNSRQGPTALLRSIAQTY